MTRLGSLGRCSCGKLMYSSRKDAKMARRQLAGSLNKRIYRCLVNGAYFHLGDLDESVKRGTMTRSERYVMTDSWETAREIVSERSTGLCEFCGGRGYEMSHRRSRRVKDEHVNCPCNLIWSCRTCHKSLHDNPAESFANGWHVSQWEEHPGAVPVLLRGSWWLLRCDGQWDFLHPSSVDSTSHHPVLIE